MNPPAKPKPNPSPLRTQAEARLRVAAKTGTPTHLADASAQELLHDLQVHQIELEMQNETLREAQIALAQSRDRYVDLYEFAPVGYLTLNAAGLIAEINLSGATLLGADRSKLISRWFEQFVAAEDFARWQRMLKDRLRQQHADELLIRRADGSAFPALVGCRHVVVDGEAGAVLLTLTDLSERREIEQALFRSEESFRRLAEISPAGIFRADTSGACTYANQRCAEIAARPVADLLGEGWIRVMHPEDRERTLAKWRKDISARRPEPMEWRSVRPDGSVRWVLSEAVVELDERGKPLGYIGCISDITDLREREMLRSAQLAEHRDTLVREVHHRIKNNLQSVAGLLQRELGKFVDLNPRLETAISQVSAIALVHGLQSSTPDEVIRLSDSVRDICKTVSDLSQRAVAFTIEHEHTRFWPVQIDRSEAVPVALVVNELILNAVKHSPHGGCNPTVSLTADGAGAQLVIRNARTGTPGFSIDSGQGLGTGLRLVRSLLPKRGAHLAFEPDAAGFMLTRLKLTAPVVVLPDHQPRSPA